jgi:hypothetical protein
VRGQTLVSGSEPAASITFDDAYVYVGGQRWDLYGIADAEQHLFVRPGAGRTVEALYWVQFERLLPASTAEYRYTGDRVSSGGLEFICDTRAYADYDAVNQDPESDGAYARRLLQEHGYELPAAAVRVRAIHLPTPDRRSELMIIHAEAQGTGDGAEALQRALAGMTVAPRG